LLNLRQFAILILIAWIFYQKSSIFKFFQDFYPQKKNHPINKKDPEGFFRKEEIKFPPAISQSRSI
jgi:hypothetical protein